MLVIMKNDATDSQIESAINHIEELGYRGIPIPGALRTAICIVGNQGFVDDTQLLSLDGVKECLRVTKPYKLVSRETHPQPTIVTLGEVAIGGNKPVIMAGPCAVENEKQSLTIALSVKK
jgi:3-deoxy-7-phosphoheptulonate synthase